MVTTLTSASLLEAVFEPIQALPAFQELLQRLGQGEPTWCTGAVQSARPVLLGALRRHLRAPLLWVTPSSDGAERLVQDLQSFLGDKDRASLFPEKEGPRMLGEEVGPADPMRLSILQSLDDGQPLLVVAPVRALLQPTVRLEHLQRGKISLRQGEIIDLELLLELLVNEGYHRVPMVERRGEISVRGGIIDVYPITGDPVRMELFGDEVESMRRFDVDTQRSTGSVSEVLLLPAREDVEGAWLSDYLPRETCVFLEEPSQLRLHVMEGYQEWAEEGGEGAWARVETMFEGFSCVHLTAWEGQGGPGGERQTLAFPFELESGFADRVEGLLKVLPEWQDQGRRIILLSRQYMRLKELFRQREIAQVLTEPTARLRPGQVLLLQGAASEGFRLQLADGLLDFLTDREIVGQRRQRRPSRTVDRGSLLRLDELGLGDLVVHLQHGIGRYLGVKTLDLQGVRRDFLHLEYAKGDSLYVPVEQLDLIQRYQGIEERLPSLSRMGGQEWKRTRARIKEETQRIALELLRIYALREMAHGYAYPPDSDWQKEMEDAFPYQETPDQSRAIREVKSDMESPRPMDRLVCGDVGYGKTEVALRASFKAVAEGRQVAVLVPTTVLAHQHFQTFSERMASYPLKVRLLSRFRSEREQALVVEEMARGEVDVVIGTHRLLSQDVKFKNLGLLVVDEEHKFGVVHKERLKEMRASVDVLTMSATPIPRTLQMSMSGVREMSLIETPPEERLPIKTYLFEHHPDLVKAAITRELAREGQVYFVHNRVQGIERLAADLRRLVPQARIAVGHGQMPEGQLEKVMMDFYEGEQDVLVCTTIIESGLDIPNVNTILINNAQHFGLAQLYQLRGRVGRSAQQGYCYLLYPASRQLTQEAERRLETIRDFTQLGAGFQVALKDLEIRGAGDILGAEQSGHVAAVGFDLYCQMLNDTVQELRGEKAPEPEFSTVLEIPIPAGLPDSYVSDPRQKVALYRKIAAVRSASGLEEVRSELRDRYGPLPAEAENLLSLADLKLRAVDLLVPAIRVKEGQMWVALPFYPEITASQREKLRLAIGWNCRYEQKSLLFEGLYGRAAGSKEYPAAHVFLGHLVDILDRLRRWRDGK